MSFFRKPTPLPTQQGGTGNQYFDYGYAIIGNGYGALLELTPSTTGNVMTSNGTTWTSAPATGVTKDGNGNITVNAVYTGFTNVAAAGTTTTLTAASTPNFVVTGSGGQTYQLPDATTLPNGAGFTFNNNQSSGTIVVKNNSGTTVTTVQSGGFVSIVLLSNSIAAGSWDYHFQAPSSVLWSTNTFTYGGSMSALSYTSTNDSTIHGLTVGLGAGAVATNTAVGASALAANTTGFNNTALGQIALVTNTGGAFNTAIGRAALNASTGDYNTALGGNTLVSNSSGANNTGLGAQALYSNTTASNNTAVGYQAGYSNTTGTITALGYRAGYANTVGGSNVAIGDLTLLNNATGVSNTAVGYSALNALNRTTGATAYSNTALGANSGLQLTTGSGNTFIGQGTGYGTTTGNKNIFVGGGDSATNYPAGYFVTTGSSNTILGCFSGNSGGLDIRTASNYIVLADGDGNPRAYWDNYGNANLPTRRYGYKFANGASAGTTGTYNVTVTGFAGQGSGALNDLSSFYYVTFLSATSSHQLQGVALYTNDYDGNAILLTTIAKREVGGTLTFSTSGVSPLITSTNTSGNTPTYYCQVVYIN